MKENLKHPEHVLLPVTGKKKVGKLRLLREWEKQSLLRKVKKYKLNICNLPYQIQNCFKCIFKLFLKTVFNLFCEIGLVLNRVKSVFLIYFSTAFKTVKKVF